MADLHARVGEVTQAIQRRSFHLRARYLERIDRAASSAPARRRLSCGNLAHGLAACDEADKRGLRDTERPSIAIVTAYNDVLSAHQPYEAYPRMIKEAVAAAGGVARVAGGVPAMCDGVTQGRPGMDLSLFSRDVIALGTAVALSHDLFDGVLCLGICDKIVPGMLIGCLAFGHLPAIFVPGGPMPTGLPNTEKAKVREAHALGRVDRAAWMEAECAAYHAPGTCTFYGTANTNQVLMEAMGLHLPGASFVSPGTPLREALTRAAAERVTRITSLGPRHRPVGRIVDERALVNAIVALLATGGSTNHTIHLVAVARAAGLRVTWDDFAALSEVTPLLARVYPNGEADVNQFHDAGGTAFVIGQLLDAGLLHPDVGVVWGDEGLHAYRRRPALRDGALVWAPGAAAGADASILAPASAPFSRTGGLRVVTGNLGRAVVKVSAVRPEHRVVEAPARVFESQEAFLDAFRAGGLEGDLVAVVRFQGPRANGMPELHSLTPQLCILQARGFRVALLTDGRMSGASGRVTAAIHATPEAASGGPLARLRDGDPILIDPDRGLLAARVPDGEWARRAAVPHEAADSAYGCGRELFGSMRAAALGAEEGALTLGLPD